jgi:hypothetical protein
VATRNKLFTGGCDHLLSAAAACGGIGSGTGATWAMPRREELLLQLCRSFTNCMSTPVGLSDPLLRTEFAQNERGKEPGHRNQSGEVMRLFKCLRDHGVG